MVLLDDVIYKETKKFVLGKSKRPPMLIEFSEWFIETFSAKMLNIEFSKLKSPNTNRYRLYIIIENTEDYQKMYAGTFKPKEDYQSRIASEFHRIALKHKFADEKQLENLFITYNDFSEEAKTEANWKATKEIKGFLRKKYPVVWNFIAMFSSSVVFYYSDFG